MGNRSNSQWVDRWEDRLVEGRDRDKESHDETSEERRVDEYSIIYSTVETEI